MDTQDLETQSPEQQEAESAAAFSSGFDSERGTSEPTEKPTETPKADDAATSDLVTPTEKAPEPQAELDPRVKAELDSVRAVLARVESIPDRLRNIEGSLGGLQQVTKDLKAAMAQAKTAVQTQGAAAPTDAQVAYAASSPERWEEMKTDFPEWADAVGGELADIRQQLAKGSQPVDLSAHNSDIDKRIASAVADAEARARIKTRIDFAHDGWEEIASSPEFNAWRDTQPKEVNDLGASRNPKDAIRMFDLYAEHRKKAAVKDEQKKRLERAVTPSGVVVTPATEDPEKAFDAGFAEVRGS